MKLTSIAAGLMGLSIGFCSVAFAGDYFPPERIHCKSSAAGRMSCEGFNHQYLTEDTFTANLTDKDEIFNFKSGVAYYTPSMNETSIFFTYNNSFAKLVKLKSTSTSIRPDLESAGWKKVRKDTYVCNTGYMSCPITNLPGSSK